MALRRREPVQARGDERMERLGHLEILDAAGGAVLRALLLQHPAVEEHADGLDGVQRTPSARSRIRMRSSSGRPGTSPRISSSIAFEPRGSRYRDVKLR